MAAAAMCLAAGAVGGAIGVRTAENKNDSPAAVTPLTNVGNGSSNSGGSVIPATNGLNVRAILAKVEPAVVDIQARSGRSGGQGTGIVVDAAQGLVVTNAHVVEAGTTITVTAPTDKQARTATLVGANTDRDVAVLKVDPAGLVGAELGSSGDVQVGDDVVAIGNALGLRGDPSVTRGIVSGLGRTVGDLVGMVQTDAAINPGNSGGPLVNAAGQVIGINTAVAGQAQNIGFAIPIDTVRTIMAQLTGGQAAAPTAFLGVSTTDADDGSPGAVVADVTAGSPADVGGIRVGDRIVSVDGAAVPGAGELKGVVQAHKPDETVKVTVVRDGKEQTFSVKLGRRP
jgi:putative serine protease PepD